MNLLDYVIMRGQQVFEDGREINPIEIKLKIIGSDFFFINIKRTK